MVLLIVLSPVAEAAANIKAGAVTTAGGSLNVRTQPSTGSSTAASLKKGSYITLHSRSGDWWKVEYDKNKIWKAIRGYLGEERAMSLYKSMEG